MVPKWEQQFPWLPLKGRIHCNGDIVTRPKTIALLRNLIHSFRWMDEEERGWMVQTTEEQEGVWARPLPGLKTSSHILPATPEGWTDSWETGLRRRAPGEYHRSSQLTQTQTSLKSVSLPPTQQKAARIFMDFLFFHKKFFSPPKQMPLPQRQQEALKNLLLLLKQHPKPLNLYHFFTRYWEILAFFFSFPFLQK